jgi:hypothetical protein
LATEGWRGLFLRRHGWHGHFSLISVRHSFNEGGLKV